MSFVFVRHAQSIGNTVSQDERVGWDIPNHMYPLTEAGKQQADFVGRYLKREYGSDFFDLAFDTDFTRSIMTLDGIMVHLDTPPLLRRTDSRLNEKWDGIFHDLTKAALKERYPDQIRLKKRTGYYLYRAPGGENGPDVEVRIRSFLLDYWKLAQEKNILVVGHGRWFLFFQKIVHGWTVAELLKRKDEGCENCSVVAYSNEVLRTAGMPSSCVPWQGEMPSVPTEYA